MRHTAPKVDVLYVSSAPSPDEFARMDQLRLPHADGPVYGMPEASFKFHTLLQEGFADTPSVAVHSLVGRAVSPRLHVGGFWRRRLERRAPNHTVDHLAFVNAMVAKHAMIAGGLLCRTIQWRWRTRRTASRIVVIDGAYVTAMPVVLLALIGARVSRIGIFCDLYSYMADVADASRRDVGPLHRAARSAVAWCVARLDAFVVLTPQMTEILPIGSRRTLVMEGLVEHNTSEASSTKTEQPTVMYAGALRREYGLDDLVRGFQSWGHPTARLVIYGAGDYAAELSRIADEDPRIDFRGAASLDVVVAEERAAWLLVNPRPIDQEFTKYSFPSKNMEYLASGTPVLTTRLPGMPAEYCEHVLLITEPGPDGVRQGLARAFQEGESELQARGRRGQAFVLYNKNNVAQAGRVVELVR